MSHIRKSNDFNLGNGEGFTVKEIIEVVERITGKSCARTELGTRRSGDASSVNRFK